MAKQRGPFTILIADDDADDCLLAQEALRESSQPHELRIVRDGQQLLDYLRRQGEFEAEDITPRPDLILLDLKMPRKDGREALSELKADRRLRSIPIVVLTTSTARDDIGFCYRMGVNSYITKPSTYRGLVDLLATVCKYWFELAELPFVD
jgi:CheY-like chemotaxis protein